MERGSASTRNEPSYADAVPGDDELVDDAGRHRTSDEVDPADFGALRPFHMTEDPHKSPGTFGASLVGTGPNGTRSFLKGAARPSSLLSLIHTHPVSLILPSYPFHGHRTGWFGLDEPTSAGYNTRPDQREKSLNGDVLPMRATNGENTDELHPHIPVVPHHRIPTSEDHDWETHSQGSNV
jgi:hypothetical protein